MQLVPCKASGDKLRTYGRWSRTKLGPSLDTASNPQAGRVDNRSERSRARMPGYSWDTGYMDTGYMDKWLPGVCTLESPMSMYPVNKNIIRASLAEENN